MKPEKKSSSKSDAPSSGRRSTKTSKISADKTKDAPAAAAPKKRTARRAITAAGAAPAKRGTRRAGATRGAANEEQVSAQSAVKTGTPRPRRARTGAASKAASVAAQSRPPRDIPPILLEGDRPSAPPAAGGPGRRYALGPTPPVQHFEDLGELPEAYGTARLFLTARDPRWLYAHWDLTDAQLKAYNSLSIDRHLILRVYRNSISGEPLSEIHVHPESRNWFVPVDQGGAKYVAALGYYEAPGKWAGISTSGATLTPPDTLWEESSIRFASIPADVPFDQLLALVKSAAREHLPLVEAVQQLRELGHEYLPASATIAAGKWTPDQEQALAAVLNLDGVRRLWIGSLEITELIRRQLAGEISSAAAAQFSLPTSPAGAISSVSSPPGGMERQKGFWFNVNAELIVYGATEPDAQVIIGGRVIKLRRDGTFSFRFALPDGGYELPISAVSADGEDVRSANLHFARSTEYSGDVGRHPQDERLKEPRAENVG